MKGMAIILLVYFSALFLVPCSDGLNLCGEPAASAGQAEHDHSEDSDDHCTPFCQCACCGVSVTIFHLYVPGLEAPVTYFSPARMARRDFPFFSAYSGSIWQPPRSVA